MRVREKLTYSRHQQVHLRVLQCVARLQAVLKAAGALALLGYRKIPEWIESAAFETLLLGELQYNAMSRSGLKSARERVKERLGGCQLLRELGFRLEIRE